MDLLIIVASGATNISAPITRCFWLNPSSPELVFFLSFFRCIFSCLWLTGLNSRVVLLFFIRSFSLARGSSIRVLSMFFFRLSTLFMKKLLNASATSVSSVNISPFSFLIFHSFSLFGFMTSFAIFHNSPSFVASSILLLLYSTFSFLICAVTLFLCNLYCFMRTPFSLPSALPILLLVLSLFCISSLVLSDSPNL